MADHRKFLALAKRLIDKHGRDVTLTTISHQPIDPDQPWLGNTPDTDVVMGPFKAVSLPYKATDFGSVFGQSSLVVEGEEFFMIAGQPMELTDNHTLTDEGTPYRIRWVQRLRPADLTLLYAIGVER